MYLISVVKLPNDLQPCDIINCETNIKKLNENQILKTSGFFFNNTKDTMDLIDKLSQT